MVDLTTWDRLAVPVNTNNRLSNASRPLASWHLIPATESKSAVRLEKITGAYSLAAVRIF